MEDVRVWLFYWLLNYWRVFQPEHFDMGDMWREIMESMPELPECALDGCDYVLFGYAPQAISCSDQCRDRLRNSTPKRKAYKRIDQKARRQTPESKAYQKAWHEAHPDYMKDYGKAYRARKKAEAKAEALS